MSFTHKIRETLYEHEGGMYRAIQLKILRSEGKFRYGAAPLVFEVSDGQNTVSSFVTIISINQKELISYFTTDAFVGFSGLASVKFGTEYEIETLVNDLDLQSIDPLPAIFASMFHSIADNAWLATL